LRLITALCGSILVALALTGCGGGSDVTQNPLATAPDTAPVTSPGTTSPGSSTPVTATAKLSWVAPTQNSNGSALTNLAGYNIYYGTDSGALTQTAQVANPAALGYVLNGLVTGTTWYFAVTSYTSSGEESARSSITRKTT
jgi:hypothetical protein